jgi:hypothetical protein
MKAIYTLQIGKNAWRNNEYCGYRCKEELLDSLLLSTRIASWHFNKVQLYCDNEAAQIIKEDGRDFPIETIACLDELSWVHEHNWSYSKVYVYSLQKEPFVHIDIDAFLWDGLCDELLQKKFIFQQMEYVSNAAYTFYKDTYAEAKQLNLLPPAIEYQAPYAMNCALFACTDTAYLFLIKEYFDVVNDYVKNNNNRFSEFSSPHFQCVMFEQLFIVNLLDKYGLQYGIGYDTILKEDFSEKYANSRFTHLIVDAKRNEKNVQAIKRSLQNLHLQLPPKASAA